MGVVRLTVPSSAVRLEPGSAVVIEAVTAGAVDGDISALVGRCAAVDGPALVGPSVTSLAAEIGSRAERRVWAWRAVLRGRPATVGVVTLVAVGAEDCRRFSIGWLFVDPAFRRRGIARALVAEAIAAARARKAAEVHVETLDRWPAAVAFWRKVQLAVGGRGARIESSGESRKTAEG